MHTIETVRETVDKYQDTAQLSMLLKSIFPRGSMEALRALDDLSFLEFVNLNHSDFIEYGFTDTLSKQLEAVTYLYKRISQLEGDVTIIRSPEDVYRLFKHMDALTQEHLAVAYLTTKNTVIKTETVFIGSLNASIVHPREIFRHAVKLHCASIVVAHNHPSGDPTPSQEDINVTKRLAEAGKVLGIEVLDHIIIGRNKHTSLKEKGYM